MSDDIYNNQVFLFEQKCHRLWWEAVIDVQHSVTHWLGWVPGCWLSAAFGLWAEVSDTCGWRAACHDTGEPVCIQIWYRLVSVSLSIQRLLAFLGALKCHHFVRDSYKKHRIFSNFYWFFGGYKNGYSIFPIIIIAIPPNDAWIRHESPAPVWYEWCWVCWIRDQTRPAGCTDLRSVSVLPTNKHTPTNIYSLTTHLVLL